MAQHGKIFSGDIYVRKFGTTDGFELLGNVVELTTKSEVEKNELIGTGRNNYGQAIDSIVTPKPTELEIKFNSFDKNALARALMGVATDKAGEVKAITETEVKVTSGWIALKHQDIDPDNFELKTKTKAKIEKDKYELNERLGMVRLLDPAAETDTLYYTGKTKGRNSFSINAGTLTNIDLEIRLDGKDRITAKDGLLEIPHAVLSANGDINWFSDNWWEAGLSGTIIKVADKPVMTFTEFE